MLVIPAIDLMDGRCVRLTKGAYDRRTDYPESPESRAAAFRDAGARELHVIDLDGAKAGHPVNLEAAKRAKAASGLVTEFGGGLRSLADLRAALTGADALDRVIVGSAAYADPGLLRAALAEFGASVWVAVDARAGQVLVKGWREGAGVTVDQAIDHLAVAGVRGIVYTDTDRDGTLEGVDGNALAPVLRRARALGLAVQYAGGVRDLADIRALGAVAGDGVLRGVVTGKAIYEGTLDLAEAVRAASA